MASVIGRIPGRLEEQRYQRTGRYSGPYRHPFGPGAITEAMSDGSIRSRRLDGTRLWLKRNDGVWLDNPRRRNPWLAIYNARKGGRTMRRYRRHNPEVLTGLMRNPMGVATDAVAGIAGLYFPIAIGNWMQTFLPAGTPGAGVAITDKLVRLGVRGGAAWAIHRFGSGWVPAGARQPLAIGMIIGVAGSFVLDLIGTNVILGSGDMAQTPMGLFRGIGLGGYADVVPRRPAIAGSTNVGMGDRIAPRTTWRALGRRF